MENNADISLRNEDSFGVPQPDIFFKPNLYGGSVSFDVDLSKVGCSCQLAFDLLNIPGYDADNMPDPGISGDYDCDA